MEKNNNFLKTNVKTSAFQKINPRQFEEEDDEYENDDEYEDDDAYEDDDQDEVYRESDDGQDEDEKARQKAIDQMVSQDKDKARENQFKKLEERYASQKLEDQEERKRLKQAVVLAEIIGSPRCRMRYGRGRKRGYGYN